MKNNYLLIIAAIITGVFFSACSDGSSDSPIGNYPSIKSSVPADGASDVAISTSSITISFDAAVYVNQASISQASISGAQIQSISSYGVILTVKISGLESSKDYTLNLPQGVLTDSQKREIPALSLCFSTKAFVADNTPDKTGMEKDAPQLISQIVAGWNLGNSLESYVEGQAENTQETSWGNPITTQQMILAVKNAGFNSVRIPVRWYPHCDNDMYVNPTWMNRVKEVVNYCIDNDMYVILNTHHELWLENHALYTDSASIHKKETALWKQIAQAFKDYDEHLIFSGTNEVHIVDNWNAPTQENATVQNLFNQWFVDAVRQSGGKNYYRNLIIQTYATNPEYGLSSLIIPSDVTANRLMVEFHYYSPYDYAGSGSVYYWGKPYSEYGISNSCQETDVDNLFSRIKTTWIDKGYPVVMGEYGVTCHFTESGKDLQSESRYYFMKYLTSKAKESGIAPFVWDNNAFGNGQEKFGIFDRNNNMAIRQPEILKGIIEGSKSSYPY